MFAAAVKKNLALFLKRVKRVFGLDGLPTTVYNEGLSHRVLNGRLATSTLWLDNT